MIIKSNSESHNHDPKLSENVYVVLCRLKYRILTDIDQLMIKIYGEEVKKFVNASFVSFARHMNDGVYSI